MKLFVRLSTRGVNEEDTKAMKRIYLSRYLVGEPLDYYNMYANTYDDDFDFEGFLEDLKVRFPTSVGRERMNAIIGEVYTY